MYLANTTEDCVICLTQLDKDCPYAPFCSLICSKRGMISIRMKKTVESRTSSPSTDSSTPSSVARRLIRRRISQASMVISAPTSASINESSIEDPNTPLTILRQCYREAVSELAAANTWDGIKCRQQHMYLMDNIVLDKHIEALQYGLDRCEKSFCTDNTDPQRSVVKFSDVDLVKDSCHWLLSSLIALRFPDVALLSSYVPADSTGSSSVVCGQLQLVARHHLYPGDRINLTMNINKNIKTSLESDVCHQQGSGSCITTIFIDALSTASIPYSSTRGGYTMIPNCVRVGPVSIISTDINPVSTGHDIITIPTCYLVVTKEVSMGDVLCMSELPPLLEVADIATQQHSPKMRTICGAMNRRHTTSSHVDSTHALLSTTSAINSTTVIDLSRGFKCPLHPLCKRGIVFPVLSFRDPTEEPVLLKWTCNLCNEWWPVADPAAVYILRQEERCKAKYREALFSIYFVNDDSQSEHYYEIMRSKPVTKATYSNLKEALQTCVDAGIAHSHHWLYIQLLALFAEYFMSLIRTMKSDESKKAIAEFAMKWGKLYLRQILESAFTSNPSVVSHMSFSEFIRDSLTRGCVPGQKEYQNSLTSDHCATGIISSTSQWARCPLVIGELMASLVVSLDPFGEFHTDAVGFARFSFVTQFPVVYNKYNEPNIIPSVVENYKPYTDRVSLANRCYEKLGISPEDKGKIDDKGGSSLLRTPEACVQWLMKCSSDDQEDLISAWEEHMMSLAQYAVNSQQRPNLPPEIIKAMTGKTLE